MTVLLGLKVLKSAAIQAEEAEVPLLVKKASQPGPRTLAVFVQIATVYQLLTVRQPLCRDLQP